MFPAAPYILWEDLDSFEFNLLWDCSIGWPWLLKKMPAQIIHFIVLTGIQVQLK